jgi:hypothetical protein
VDVSGKCYKTKEISVMKKCLCCLSLYDDELDSCQLCDKKAHIILATNDDEHAKLMAQYESAEHVLELGKRRFVLIDDTRLVYFFKSSKAAIEFSRGFAPLKRSQTMLRFNEIVEVGLPTVTSEKNKGRVLKFVMHTSKRKREIFHCASGRHGAEVDATFYHFCSILLTRCQLYYRRMGKSIGVLPYKWLYAGMIALTAFLFGMGFAGERYEGFRMSGILVAVPILFYYTTHGKGCKLYFIKDKKKADAEDEIVKYESIRKKDLQAFWVMIFIVTAVFLFAGWLVFRGS